MRGCGPLQASDKPGYKSRNDGRDSAQQGYGTYESGRQLPERDNRIGPLIADGEGDRAHEQAGHCSPGTGSDERQLSEPAAVLRNPE